MLFYCSLYDLVYWYNSSGLKIRVFHCCSQEVSSLRKRSPLPGHWLLSFWWDKIFPMFAMKWWDQMPWSSFSEWSFKPTFSLSTFTFIKRFFSSSSLSAIRVVSSAYLRLLIFLPAILIPVCAFSSPAFLMMYSAYKLSKQPALMYSFSYLEPVCCSMSNSNCCFLTCIQISQEAGQVVWYSHLFQNFPQFIVIHTVKALA